MKIWFLSVVGWMVGSAVLAQDNSLIRIRPWDDVEEVIPYSRRYQYQPFQQGHVVFANGRSSASYKLNYDILFGEMRMIKAPHPDTLFIVNTDALKYVFIGNDIYYHDYHRGYIRLLAEAHSSQLGVRSLLRKKRRESSFTNGYSLAVDNTSAVYSGSDVLLETRMYFYLITDDDVVRKVSRSNLLKAFPQHQAALEDYLSKEKVNLRNEEDLKKLFVFCAGLKTKN